MEGIVVFKSHSKRSSTVHLTINKLNYETGELFAQLSSSGVSAVKSVKFRKKHDYIRVLIPGVST